MFECTTVWGGTFYQQLQRGRMVGAHITPLCFPPKLLLLLLLVTTGHMVTQILMGTGMFEPMAVC